MAQSLATVPSREKQSGRAMQSLIFAMVFGIGIVTFQDEKEKSFELCASSKLI